jgi:excisionase family DNA binding protein
MSDLATALIAALDDQALDQLAELLEPRLRELDTEGAGEVWMTTPEAAAYLKLSVDALHRLTAPTNDSGIPFHRDTPGGKCYFNRLELDAWRMNRNGSGAA